MTRSVEGNRTSSTNQNQENLTVGNARWLLDAGIAMKYGTARRWACRVPELSKSPNQGAERNVGYDDDRGGSGEDRYRLRTD